MNTKKYHPDHIVITDEAHREARLEKERLGVPLTAYTGALMIVGLKHKEEVKDVVEAMTNAE